jgi:hypothetical protein
MPQPQQQYRLRLGEGTLLLVDRDALNAWLMDERAMVQPVGTKRWRTLKQFLADEREAAFYSSPAPAAPSRPPTPGPLPLVYPPNMIPRGAAPAPPPAVEEPKIAEPAVVPPALGADPLAAAVAGDAPAFVPEEMETFDPTREPPPLNVPLPPITNVPLLPPEERAPAAVAPPEAPSPIIVPEPEPAPIFEAPVIAAPAPAPPKPKPARRKVPAVAASPPIATPPTAPPAREPAPPPAELRDLIIDAPPVVPAESPESFLANLQELATVATERPPDPAPVPLPEAFPAMERAYAAPASFARPPLQVLADDTAFEAPPASSDDNPVIAFKPLDDAPAPSSALDEPAEMEPNRDARPRGHAAGAAGIGARATAMVSEWGDILGGWVQALDQRSHERPTSPRESPHAAPPRSRAAADRSPSKASAGATTVAVSVQRALASARTMAESGASMVRGWIGVLEARRSARATAAAAERDRPLSLLSPLDLSIEKPAAPRVVSPPPPLEREPEFEPPPPPPTPARRPVPVASVMTPPPTLASLELVPLRESWTQRLRGWFAAWTSSAAGWIQGLRRGRDHATPEAGASVPRAWIEPISGPPPAVAPLPVAELPVLRLAPIEAAPEEGEVYDGELEGPGLLDAVGLWAKRVLLVGGLMAGGFIAYVTWQTWLPKAGRFGVTVVSEIEKQVPNPAAERARREALESAAAALPHLDPQTVQLLMSRHGVIPAVEVFDAAYRAAEKGMPALSPEEAAEMMRLRAELLSMLTPAEQTLVRDHERIRRITPSADDSTILELVARAARELPPESRGRLHVLSAKAVAAALAEPPAPDAEASVRTSAGP